MKDRGEYIMSEHTLSVYTCEDVLRDIEAYFAELQKLGEQKMAAVPGWKINKALAHMTAGSTPGHHNIACQKCLDRYEQLKRQYCGG